MSIELNSITHMINEQVILNNFTLTIKQGILGVLGPNGAGKTTLLKLIATILKPSSGEISWKGKNLLTDNREYRFQLGYLPQNFGVYPNLNVIEFLEYVSALKGLHPKHTRQRIYELVENLNLQHDLKKPLGGYSGGMKQRVGIAQALLNDPSILILDEPTVGLDPEERISFRNMLSKYEDEKIIIYSTHIVPDIQTIASNIVIMKKGSILYSGKPDELLKHNKGDLRLGKARESNLEDAYLYCMNNQDL